jgi:hypothetical protein
MTIMTAINAAQRSLRSGASLPERGRWGTRASIGRSCLADGPVGYATPAALLDPTKAFAGAAGHAVVTDPHGSVSGRSPG